MSRISPSFESSKSKSSRKHRHGNTGSDGAGRSHNGAGVISYPVEEAPGIREREMERPEKTDAVSSVYLVTALDIL